jgi:hypothetical protein
LGYAALELNTQGLWIIAIVAAVNIQRRVAPRQELKMTSTPPRTSITPTPRMIFEAFYLMNDGSFKFNIYMIGYKLFGELHTEMGLYTVMHDHVTSCEEGGGWLLGHQFLDTGCNEDECKEHSSND